MRQGTSGCPPDETILAYLEHRLPEEKASELEEHCFNCERCGREVERGIEIRAAFAPSEGNAGVLPSKPAGWTRWKIWAAAAVLVVSIGGVLSVWRPKRTSEDLILRGGEVGVEVAMDVSGSQLDLSWSPVAGAHVYIVESFQNDGRPLFDLETNDTHASVDLEARPNLPRTTFWRIQALGPVRETLASSELLRLELPDRP